jgi:hypothetical protein
MVVCFPGNGLQSNCWNKGLRKENFVLELLVDIQNRHLVIIDPSGDVLEDGYFRVHQERCYYALVRNMGDNEADIDSMNHWQSAK